MSSIYLNVHVFKKINTDINTQTSKPTLENNWNSSEGQNEIKIKTN